MQAYGLWSFGLLLAMGAGCGNMLSIEGRPSPKSVPAQAQCSPSGEVPCAEGYVCVVEAGRESGTCRQSCDEDSDCFSGAICERAAQADAQAPLFCQAGCRVHSSTQGCANGYICNAQLSAGAPTCQPKCHVLEDGTEDSCGGQGKVCIEGICQDGCRRLLNTDDAEEEACPEGELCVVEAGKSIGSCQPGCHLMETDSGPEDSCEEGHVCVVEGNARLGLCREGCRIYSVDGALTDTCAKGSACVGEHNQTNSIGACRPEWCRVGSTTHACADNHICIGYRGNLEPGAAGLCKRRCRTLERPCNTPHECFNVDETCRDPCSGSTDLGGDRWCGDGDVCGDGVCRAGCRVGSGGCLAGQICESMLLPAYPHYAGYCRNPPLAR